MKYFLFWVVLIVMSLGLGVLIAGLVSAMVYWAGPIGAVPVAFAYFVVLLKIPSFVDRLAERVGL